MSIFLFHGSSIRNVSTAAFMNCLMGLVHRTVSSQNWLTSALSTRDRSNNRSDFRSPARRDKISPKHIRYSLCAIQKINKRSIKVDIILRLQYYNCYYLVCGFASDTSYTLRACHMRSWDIFEPQNTHTHVRGCMFCDHTGWCCWKKSSRHYYMTCKLAYLRIIASWTMFS